MNEDESGEEAVRNEMMFAMIAMRSMLEPVINEVENYRIDMLKKGYNDYDARAMAVDYHGVLMWMLRK